MRNWLSMGIMLWLMACCTGCEKNGNEKEVLPTMPDRPITIVYENDVHCAVDGYAQLVKVRDSLMGETPYVSTVSCGDFVQGSLVGSVSQGEYIVDIMNRANYDVVALGNHEFDYGMEQLFHLTERLSATVVCANLRDLRMERPVFVPYHIVRYGQTDVAFVGLLTTSTPTSTSPLNYQDSTGRVVYTFMKEQFYAEAQQQINAARAEGADYVVALSHLGDIPEEGHPTSLTLIAETTGVDAVLDGHSHSTIPDTVVCNKEGQPVHLSSTGTELEHIGLLTIETDGSIATRLFPTEGRQSDTQMQAYIEEIKEKAAENGRQVVGLNTVTLIATDEEGNRLVRLKEMPLGNLCADAFCHVLNTDVALINGGGIRSDMPQGEVTYNDLLTIFPFGNTACTATLTGQQLSDALECSVRFLPEENGSFMQVSGMRFMVNPSSTSPVVFDDNGLFSHVPPTAPRRVSHIYIRNRESGEYLPLDPKRVYTLASFDYLLKELGGDGMLRHATLSQENLGMDAEILASYIRLHLGETIGAPYDKVEGRIEMKSDETCPKTPPSAQWKGQ